MHVRTKNIENHDDRRKIDKSQLRQFAVLAQVYL